MEYEIDVCTADVGKIIRFYRVVEEDKVLGVYEISEEEYSEINRLLSGKGYKSYQTKILSLHSYCFTYYDVDSGTVKEITGKFGKLIPKGGGK